MNDLPSVKIDGITFISSGQLWSNVALRNTKEGMEAMLVNPSFLDLFNLSKLFTAATVLAENSALREAGEITQFRFKINESRLLNIQKGIDAHYKPS